MSKNWYFAEEKFPKVEFSWPCRATKHRCGNIVVSALILIFSRVINMLHTQKMLPERKKTKKTKTKQTKQNSDHKSC